MTELFSHPSGAPLGLPTCLGHDVPGEVCDGCRSVALLQEESDPGPVPPGHVCDNNDDCELDLHVDYAAPAAPPMPVEQPLTPMAAGTFAFYDDGAGGAMLVMQPAGGEVLRKHIPANMVRMIGKFTGASGGIGSLLGMFGGR